jgi:hypothetical protein
MFKACHSRDSFTTLCHTRFTQQRRHIIDVSKGKFGKIYSITNAFVKKNNRCFGYSLGFSWLWGHFEGLDFGVQGTTFEVCGGENRFSIFGKKTRCFVSSFGGSKSVCLKESFSHTSFSQLKFGKNHNLCNNM